MNKTIFFCHIFHFRFHNLFPGLQLGSMMLLRRVRCVRRLRIVCNLRSSQSERSFSKYAVTTVRQQLMRLDERTMHPLTVTKTDHNYNMFPNVIISDLSGTLCDFRGKGTIGALMSTFKAHGFKHLTRIQLEDGMGLPKSQHIHHVLKSHCSHCNNKIYNGTIGKTHYAELVQKITNDLEERLNTAKTIPKIATPVEGVADTIREIRRRYPSILFGVTTGFSKKTCENILNYMKTYHGIIVDGFCTPDMVGGTGRPSPAMILHLLRNKWHLKNVKRISGWKIGDTLADIDEVKTLKEFESFSVRDTSACTVIRNGPEEVYKSAQTGIVYNGLLKETHFIHSFSDILGVLDGVLELSRHRHRPT